MAKTKKKVKKKIVKSKKQSVKPVAHEEKAKIDSVLQEKPVVVLHPTAGAKISDFEETLDKQLAGDTGPPKRPVGRPPKEPEPEPPELTIEVVAGVVKIPFELWAISQGLKGLALSDDEAKQIAEPARQLLEYYLPKVPVIAYAWVSFSVSTFWVMRTRLLLIQEIKKQREKSQAPAPSAPAQPGVVTKFPDINEPVKI